MHDIAIIGGGVAGVYATIASRKRDYTVRAFDRNEGLGGTWYVNRYPGARCDIESLEYSYGFDDALQQDWEWSERFASQSEILSYIQHVAQRYDVHRHFQLGTGIVSARYESDSNSWLLTTDNGSRSRARWLIAATGGHSIPRRPNVPGEGDFEGVLLHSSDWTSSVDAEGKRIAVIGTGPSAIQCVPEVAKVSSQVYVLQRTPNYVVPANNAPVDRSYEQRIKTDYQDFRRRCSATAIGIGAEYEPSRGASSAFDEHQRREEFDRRWASGGFTFVCAFDDMATSRELADSASRFIRTKIQGVVSSSDVADTLSPTHPFGSRRLCVGTNYYETFNRSNVELIDLAMTPISHIDRHGINLSEHISEVDLRGEEVSVKTRGRHLDVDIIVLATGFEAQHSALHKLNLHGLQGSLSECWEQRPMNYLGLVVAGFPNFFMVNGPGSPGITTNMIANAELGVDWILDCIDTATRCGYERIEADADAQAEWSAMVDRRAKGMLINLDKSRYVDETPNGTRYVLPFIGMGDYIREVTSVAATGYPGFTFTSHSQTNHQTKETPSCDSCFSSSL